MNAHVEQFQPVSQAPVRNEVIGAGWQARARNQAPQAPQPAGPESQHDEVAIRAQHTLHLAQDRVRPVAVIERVRQ